MKRIITFGLLVAAAFALTNCAQKESYAPVQVETEEIVSFQITANLPAETKTFNNGMSTEWSENDSLKLSYTLGEYNGSFSNPFTTTGYGTDSDGVFTGEIDLIKDGLDVAGALTGILELTAVYPYTEGIVSADKLVPMYTVQNGYGSMAHLAGKNLPLYGSVKIDMKDQSLSDLWNRKITVPGIQMQHATSIVELHVTNDTDAPAVIDTVGFRVGQELKGFTIVENATELQSNETATIYIITKPFTVPAGSQKIEFWVNNTAIEFNVTDADVTFSPGKIKKVAVKYTDEDELYAVADVTVEQTVERIVPSVNTLLDLNYLKQWVENLKAQEDIKGVLTDAMYAFGTLDFDGAYEILGGIPGFEHQVKVVPGSARCIKKVDHEVTDYITSFLESLGEVNSVESLLDWIEDVEKIYAYTGVKAEFLGVLGTLENYADALTSYLDSLGDSFIAGLAKVAVKSAFDSMKNFSLTRILSEITENEKISKYILPIIDHALFEGGKISQSLFDSFKKVLEKIDEQWHPVEDPTQSDIDIAVQQALFQALLSAGANSDAALDELNNEEISDLEKGIWGIFFTILENEDAKNLFVEYQLESVYDILVNIAEFLRETVTYDNTTAEYLKTYENYVVLTPNELAIY